MKPTDVIPYFMVEVTASAAIIDTESRIVGDNVVDTTLQFAWRADDMPPGVTDERVITALSGLLGRVTTILQLSMTGNKWVFLGSTGDPERGRGEVVRISTLERPSVVMPMGTGPEGRA